MRPLFAAVFLSLAATASFADFAIRLAPPLAIDDERRMNWRVTITNKGTQSVADQYLVFYASGTRVVAVPEGSNPRCTIEFGDQGRCRIDLAPGETRELTFTAQGYHRPYGWFWAGAESGGAVASEVAVFGHPFVVTTTADDGPGSLRQAILDVNAASLDGDPATIAFDLGENRTIRLLSLLPEITSLNLFIDGKGGVVLDGSALTEGDGLVLRGGHIRVAGLTVSGFPGNGIFSSAGYLSLQHNRLERNGLRGVQIPAGTADVDDNVIRDNTHAGAWITSAATIRMRRNVVTGNGASGLFFHKPHVSYSWSLVEDNEIAGNAHAGIAVSRVAVGSFGKNSIYENGGGAIDIQIDGPTLETRGGVPGQGGILGAPTITSARYDGRETIIEGRLGASPGASHMYSRVNVYANSRVDANGMAEAEELLAVVDPRFAATFTLRVPRDLRGMWISASTFGMYVYNWDDPAPGTSEVGLPARVE